MEFYTVSAMTERNPHTSRLRRGALKKSVREGMTRSFTGHLLSLLFLIVNLSVFVNCDSHCPAMCECLWRGGKQTAECAGQTLMTIPLGVSPSSQVINLSRNKFQSLPPKVFQDRGLINLQKIYLSECELGRIAPDAFIQLTNLVELDLSSNVLTSVPSESLQHTPSLRRLNLHHNPIQAILRDSFSNLKHLHFLELSDCQIESIDGSAFKDLEALEQLKLDGNRLSTLPGGLFKGIQLASIGLHRNPWKCDCELRPTIEWLNKVRLVPNLWPTCASPAKLKGAMWNSMDIASYACPPVFKVRETEMKAPLGTNLSLVCIVKSTPQARIFWSFEEPVDSGNSTTMIFDNSKYSIMEDPTAGPDLMRSTLTIHDLDTADSKRNYICSAENQAAVTSKNFTISLYSSMSAITWSKVEIAGTVIALILGSIIALALLTVCFLRLRKDSNQSSSGDKSGLPSIDVLKSIKSIGRSIHSSSEHKVISDSSLKQSKTDIGSSSGYGSNGVTPDITSNVIKSLDYKPMCPPIDYYPGLLQVNNQMCKSASYELKSDLSNVHLPVDDNTPHRPLTTSTTVGNYANYENQDALAYNYNLNFHDSIGYTHFDTPYYYYNNSMANKDHENQLPPNFSAIQQATIANSYTNISSINGNGGGGTVSMIEDGSNSIHCLEKHDQAGLTNASPMHQPIHEANLINLHHVNVVGQGSYCNISHPTIVRYSPDEGYAEEQANPSFVLEGTEV